MIIAAAQAGRCRYLLTEDLQAGQDIEGMIILSPFEAGPEICLNGPQ